MPAPNARQILLVDQAVRDAIAGVMSGTLPPDLAVAVAVARIVGSGGDDAAELPAERPAERRNRANAEALVLLDELLAQGKGRSAASILAKRMARDPGEVEVLTQHLRRLRRRQKKNEQCSVAGPQNV